MKLNCESKPGATLVDNTFIDCYMAKANGEFVKVYLFLLRSAGEGRDVTIPGIADFFEQTEGDVVRALNYWQSAGLISMSLEADGSIGGIRILTCRDAQAGEQSSSAAALGMMPQAASPASSRTVVPAKTASPVSSSIVIPAKTASSLIGGTAPASGADFSGPGSGAAASDARAFGPETSAEDPAEVAEQQKLQRQLDRAVLQRLLFVAEQYFQHPLSSSERDMLEYFVGDLHMSADLVEFLLEYCLDKGHPSVRYMEKVAQAWISRGITTVKEARDEVRSFGGDYTAIFRELGLTRQPAPAEIKLMDKWLSEYSFSLDIIKEACRRTLMQTSQPSLSYADGILTSWNASGVKTADEIRRLDAEHEAVKKSRDGGKGKTARRPQSSGQFSGYSHEDADWNALSMQVMQQQKKG